MKNILVLPLLFALVGDDPEAAKAQRERLYKLHLGDVLEFTIYRDAARKEPLEFRKQPIYVWTNPVRTANQDGLVFLWTSRGRAEAVGTIFSSTAGPMRGFTHEFHSLSMGTSVRRPSGNARRHVDTPRTRHRACADRRCTGPGRNGRAAAGADAGAGTRILGDHPRCER